MPQNDIATKSLKIPNAVILPEVIKLIDEGHTVTLRVKGFSMRPFLENGRDKALLAKAENPQVGDAGLAEIRPKFYVLHRIIKIYGENVTLRGDANLSNEHCNISDIKGKAIGFYRKGRERLDKTDGKEWLAYSWIWMHLYPIRRYLLAIYRHLWLPLFPVKKQEL